MRLIDLLAKELGFNTDLLFIASFNSKNHVTLLRADSGKLIGIVTRDAQNELYSFTDHSTTWTSAINLSQLLVVIKTQAVYPHKGLNADRNFSKAVYKPEFVAVF